MVPVNAKYFKLSVGKLKKDTSSEISCCCPACGDTKDRLHLISTPDFDYVKCFNSGCELEESTSVYRFLQVINSNYISAYKRETLTDRIHDIKTGEDLNGIMARLKAESEPKPEPEPEKKPEIPLDKLFKKCTEFPECVQYLENRGIKPQQDWYFSTQKFFKFKDKNVFLQNYLLIPIYEDGKYRGFYSRSIEEKRFSTFLLDGTEKIWTNQRSTPEIICEGIFDALSTGYENCAAMIGATVSDEYSDQLPKSTIFAFDNDTTGTEKSIQYAKKGFTVFVWPEVPEKDFNDLLKTYPKEHIKQFVQENLFRGIQAETRLRIKKV